MKNLKNVVSFIIITLLLFLLTACSDLTIKEDVIKINGEFEDTVEVGEEYIDPGVSYPENKYYVVVDGKVSTSRTGRKEIKYDIYSSDGEFIKTLHRFVTVVDTTPPTYLLLENRDYYVGFNYYLFDFISYSDNGTDSSNLFALAKPAEYTFTRAGQQSISFELSDLSNNTTIVNINISPIFDFYEIAKNVSSNVTQGDNEVTGKYITFRSYIGSKQISIMYYEERGSLHYREEIDNKKSIQISAKFGEFSNADVTYHINGTDSTYTVGFASIDATKEATSVNSFWLGTNNLNLDENEVLEELNQYIGDVLSNFQKYMKNNLHLDIY